MLRRTLVRFSLERRRTCTVELISANFEVMNYYNLQIEKLKKEVYSKEYLVQQIIEAKQFIDTNFNENIDLNIISKKACLSKFHFIRSFKNTYGVTPHQYLISVRIKEAKKLLSNNIGIAETYVATGFESITSFIGLFKKMIGTTPDLYRRKKQFSRVH